ncbi:AAA family ATPase, partial [Streptomyces sp. NPDC001002]
MTEQSEGHTGAEGQEVFVGRHAERALFEDGIARDPGPDGSRRLIHVHGVAGVGKSTLLLHWQATARSHGAATAVVDAAAVCSVAEAMEAVGAELGFPPGRLMGFGARPALDEGQREADGSAVAPDGQAPPPSGQIAAQSLKGASASTPGPAVGPDLASPAMIGRHVDWMRATERDQRPRERRTDEHDTDATARIGTAFVRELVRLARQQPFLVLFFDTWERSGEFLDEWVRALLLDRFGPLPGNVVVVLAGRDPLDENDWAGLRAGVTEVPLEVFTEPEARDLLAARGVTDEAAITSILDTALGLPLLLDMLAGTRPSHLATRETAGESVDSAVDRYLDRIDDTGHRDAVLGCSLPLRFDEETFRAAVPAAEPDLFPWLRARPFVTDREGHFRYHDAVRTSMLHHQRASSPRNWIDDHTRLAEAFAGRRTAHEADLAADKRWADGTWRGHRLNET